MSAGDSGGSEWPSNRESDGGGEETAVPLISGGVSADRPVIVAVEADEKEARVSLVGADESAETRVSDESGGLDLKLENEENRLDYAGGGDLENQPGFSVSGDDKKNVDNKVEKSMADYDSLLSEFDQFASGGAEAAGSGYEIGDMVWGKVKSHPWWPGHVYNEAFASQSVHRNKRDGLVLVAFFGDSSYGWFHPSELVPFEENCAEKSRQTSSRAFVKAVEEAVGEISRRQGVGLACCCRNEFNFRPSTVADHFVVDVGGYEPGVYSLSQINKARGDFRTKELLLFVRQLALKPTTDQHWDIELIKNRSSFLGCRKAFFEEFDETYAQAFGTAPTRPLRPTAPMAVDPSKALLSCRQVFAETPGKGKHSAKSNKPKEEVEKDKYLFTRRDAPVLTKTKKTSPAQVPLSPHPLSDGSGLTQVPVDYSIKLQTPVSEPPNDNDKASVVSGIQFSVGSKKLVVNSGQKKAKVRKRGESSAENVNSDIKKTKKRKKEIRNESSSSIVQLPLDVPLGNQKKDEEGDKAVVELLSFLVRDLCALALDPFYGKERNCPSSTQLAFLKYRSLVYQKSMVSLPSTGNEAIEAHTSTLPASNALLSSTEKSTMKLKKPSARHIHDPTIGGKKRGPETVKKKKPSDMQNIKKKLKIAGSEEVKKKKILVDSRSQQKSTETASASTRSVPPKAVKVKLESSSKRMNEQPSGVSVPTMLVMKFPLGASLPSGNELKAKFARFGALDLNATRVFWKTSTCRLVYRRKVDAEEALDFAVGSHSLFGSTRIRCYVREVEVDAPVESEPIKPSQSRESAFEHNNRSSANINTSSQQLKSCLKKPSDEGGNGHSRGTRVKFILGDGEGSGSKTRDEQVYSPSMRNVERSMESSGVRNLPKFTPHSPIGTPLMTSVDSDVATLRQFQKSPIDELQNPTAEDISPQFLNLLTRCSDVVSNVTGALGYMPYHAL